MHDMALSTRRLSTPPSPHCETERHPGVPTGNARYDGQNHQSNELHALCCSPVSVVSRGRLQCSTSGSPSATTNFDDAGKSTGGASTEQVRNDDDEYTDTDAGERQRPAARLDRGDEIGLDVSEYRLDVGARYTPRRGR